MWRREIWSWRSSRKFHRIFQIEIWQRSICITCRQKIILSNCSPLRRELMRTMGHILLTPATRFLLQSDTIRTMGSYWTALLDHQCAGDIHDKDTSWVCEVFRLSIETVADLLDLTLEGTSTQLRSNLVSTITGHNTWCVEINWYKWVQTWKYMNIYLSFYHPSHLGTPQ